MYDNTDLLPLIKVILPFQVAMFTAEILNGIKVWSGESLHKILPKLAEST